MDTIPDLRAERLLLRGFRPADAPATQALVSAREIADTTLNIPHPYPEGGAAEWIASHAEGARTGKQWHFAIVRESEGILVGAITLRVHSGHKRAELGYWIGLPYWGQGYATEAARCVIAFGFDALGLNRIYAGYFTRNPASRRVQEKAGMTFEGVLRQDVCKNGAYEDLGMCAILRQDYCNAPSCAV